MTQPRRSSHFRTFLVLSLVLPTIFAGGLLSRKPPAPFNSVAAWPAGTTTATGTVREFRQRLANAEVVLSERDGERWLTIENYRLPLSPEVLAYWSSRSPGNRMLPAEASLLGQLQDGHGGPWRLPPEAANSPGFLTFYSLGLRQVMAAAALEGVR